MVWFGSKGIVAHKKSDVMIIFNIPAWASMQGILISIGGQRELNIYSVKSK